MHIAHCVSGIDFKGTGYYWYLLKIIVAIKTYFVKSNRAGDCIKHCEKRTMAVCIHGKTKNIYRKGEGVKSHWTLLVKLLKIIVSINEQWRAVVV